MKERTGSITESVLVSAIIIGGIVWFVCYKTYIGDHMHWQLQLHRFPIYGHCLLLFGIPIFIALVLYWGWKTVKYVSRHKGIKAKGEI